MRRREEKRERERRRRSGGCDEDRMGMAMAMAMECGKVRERERETGRTEKQAGICSVVNPKGWLTASPPGPPFLLVSLSLLFVSSSSLFPSLPPRALFTLQVRLPPFTHLHCSLTLSSPLSLSLAHSVLNDGRLIQPQDDQMPEIFTFVYKGIQDERNHCTQFVSQ